MADCRKRLSRIAMTCINSTGSRSIKEIPVSVALVFGCIWPARARPAARIPAVFESESQVFLEPGSIKHPVGRYGTYKSGLKNLAPWMGLSG